MICVQPLDAISVKQAEKPQMECRVLWRHTLGYTVCFCPTKRMSSLNDLNNLNADFVWHKKAAQYMYMYM